MDDTVLEVAYEDAPLVGGDRDVLQLSRVSDEQVLQRLHPPVSIALVAVVHDDRLVAQEVQLGRLRVRRHGSARSSYARSTSAVAHPAREREH
ncbi:MAG TPA: hypothetical protein VNI54_14100 [Thermoanaerobaculia bacterium]|nr:hypothetical protein [Thermoanaerobaculia bacterium]